MLLRLGRGFWGFVYDRVLMRLLVSGVGVDPSQRQNKKQEDESVKREDDSIEVVPHDLPAVVRIGYVVEFSLGIFHQLLFGFSQAHVVSIDLTC